MSHGLRRRRPSAAPIACGLAVVCLLGSATVAYAGRYQAFTEKYKSRPDQARVVTAGCLGGAGTEWLVGGGFLPDGTVVVVGTALGPELTLGGRAAVVLGAPDTPAPPVPQQVPELDPKGKPKTDKDGKVRLLPFGWTSPHGTAFVALLSADLKEIRRAVRLPWGTGAATSACVGPDGAVYVAGVGEADLLAKLPGHARLDPPTLETKVPVRCTWLVRFDAGLGKIEWVRTLTGPSVAPRATIEKRTGRVLFTGVDVRSFDAAGAHVVRAVVPAGIDEHTAVNPTDGSYAWGHEHHWQTGREPWRCPQLLVHKPDGTLQHHLYDWGGPFVGLNNLRLVSDSAIRLIRYDDDGHLLLYAWSDGGNSVMLREPFDVRQYSEKMNGLGMSAWGAGVLSIAYVIRIEAETYKVSAGTTWLAFLSQVDKPNSIWVDALGTAADGSVVLGGRSADGIVQTGNHLNATDLPGGNYVAVLDREMKSVRFSSVLPGCGRTHLANKELFGFATGNVAGKARVLCFSGAVAEDASYDRKSPVPHTAAWQNSHGGGATDGHLLVLDLDP